MDNIPQTEQISFRDKLITTGGIFALVLYMLIGAVMWIVEKAISFAVYIAAIAAAIAIIYLAIQLIT